MLHTSEHNARPKNPRPTQDMPKFSALAYVVVISTAANTVLLISRLGTLSWTESAILACSAAALMAGALFTMLEMHKLHRDVAVAPVVDERRCEAADPAQLRNDVLAR